MDAKIIKAQIAFWQDTRDSVKQQIKTLESTLTGIDKTLKALQGFLPKEKANEVDNGGTQEVIEAVQPEA